MVASYPASSNNAAFPGSPNINGQSYALGDLSGLTLANGMTAGYGVPTQWGTTPGDTANPAQQPGLYGGNPTWAPQRIGVLRNLPGTAAGTGSGGFYSLYFAFNPNQINVSFSVNLTSTPPLALYGAGGDSGSSIANTIDPGGDSGAIASQIPNYANSQTVAWSLIFDRTYDFIRDPRPDLDRGVLKDVAALYNIMGTFDTAAGVPISTPVQVVFGMTGSGQLWGFTGYISSVNITYGIFRQNMIPSRCEIDLQLTCTYVSTAAPTSTTTTPPASTNPVTNLPAAATHVAAHGAAQAAAAATSSKAGTAAKNAAKTAAKAVKF